MYNKNTKSEDFYLRFEQQLKDSQSWPGDYLFKFILKDDPNLLNKLKNFLDKHNGELTKRSSSNNKFCSITFKYNAANPSDVIKIYKEVSVIDSIISL